MRYFVGPPTSPSPALPHRGPSLSPLKGGEEAFSLRTCDCAMQHTYSRFQFPGRPCAKAGIQTPRRLMDPGSPLRYGRDDELGRCAAFFRILLKNLTRHSVVCAPR
jgi:hypothetical protein